MMCSINELNSFKRLRSAVNEFHEIIKDKAFPDTIESRNYEVEKAKKILCSQLHCGCLKSVELTKERLMYEKGFTEIESIEILKHLVQEGLINGYEN